MRAFQACLITVGLAHWTLVWTGCQASISPEATAVELSLRDQIAAVQAGKIARIQVESASVSDGDLAALADAAPLGELLLDNEESRVSSAGLANLHRLEQLTHFRIRSGTIDDAALSEIAKIRSLRILNVPRSEFTDEGLAQLADLPDLEMLRFGSRGVTDSGMQTFGRFPSLKRLHLIDVPITDAGLAELAKIERLESLYIDGGNISDEAWERLFRERPKLHVHVNQQHHDRDPHRHPH